MVLLTNVILGNAATATASLHTSAKGIVVFSGLHLEKEGRRHTEEAGFALRKALVVA